MIASAFCTCDIFQGNLTFASTAFDFCELTLSLSESLEIHLITKENGHVKNDKNAENVV